MEANETTIRCRVCGSALGTCPRQDVERAIGAAGWIRTPMITVCAACSVWLRAALGIVQTRYERIGMEALKQAAQTQAALNKLLTDAWPI